MDKRRRHRLRTVMVTFPLALGAALPAAASAQASDATYHCQGVILDSGGAITPLYGFGCQGPVPWSAPGTVREVPSGTLYHCQVLEPNSYPEGMTVFGVVCEEV